MAKIYLSTNNSNWGMFLNVSETSYSIENNTSSVTASLYLYRPNSASYYGGSASYSITVNGETKSGNFYPNYPTNISAGEGNAHLVGTQTYTVSHNADGSKTASVSASFSANFSPSSASGSGNITLTTIPRASSISCNGGNIGSSTTITISRASSSFTHTLIYSFGNLTNRTIVTKTSSTSVSWTIPTTFYAQIPNSNSGTVTLECWTYSGNTLVGKKNITCTVNVTNSNPTFNTSQLTYLDSNSSVVAITSNNQHIVRNQSNLKVTYTAATGKNSATISSYVITFNGGTQTKNAAATIDYGTVNLSSNATVSVKAIDSRGNSTTISKTIQIKDWVLPSATVTANRVNNYEDETHLKANVTISSVNGKNAIQSIQYRYKKSGTSTYSSYVSMSNNVQNTLSIDKLYAWDFQIAIADKFGSTTYNFTIAKGMPIMFIDTKKLSIGINSFPSSDNSFNVDGKITKNGVQVENGVEKSSTNLDDFKSWLINTAPVGSYLVNLNVNGGLTCAIVEKASSSYLSFIRFGYGLNARQYKYSNNYWSEVELEKYYDNYTTASEVPTNKRWIDGKPIYRKVINTTQLVTNDTTIAHSISNVDRIWIDKAFMTNTDGVTWDIPIDLYGVTNTSTDRVGVCVDKSVIQFKCDTTWDTWWTKTVILECTKTTD